MDDMMKHHFLSALLLVILLAGSETCTVDSGQFLQILQVQEELPLDHVIGSLDLDDPSSVSTLSIKEPNPYIDLVVNEEGSGATFNVIKRIDVDTGLYRLQTMVVECTKTTGLKLLIEVEFEIEDINDHAPEFLPSSKYNFTVSERALPGSQIALVEAKDGDIKNMYIQYEVSADKDDTNEVSKLFELRRLPNGGNAIFLLTNLDYETQKNYTLHIIAKDCQSRRNCELNQKSSTAQVLINVKDEDDLNPTFDKISYQVALSQDTKNDELVVQVGAHDQDDLDEEVIYSLSGDGREYFHMDSVTGKVTVRDSTGLVSGRDFLLQAKAAQKSDPSKKDTATLFISVISTDWDKPQFTERTYVTSISEYVSVNSSVLSLGINYDLQRDPLVVQIESAKEDTAPFFATRHLGNNVDLILMQSLDFEKQKSHTVKIIATNGKHSDIVEVTIHVMNENDNNPVFDQLSYSFQTAYKQHGIVGKVAASDADSPSEDVSYRLLQSDINSLFSIDEEGTITLAGDESLYIKESYTLIVEASDEGTSPRTTNAVITISFNGVKDISTGSVKSSSPLQDSLVYIIIAAVGLMILIFIVVIACLVYIRRSNSRRLSKMQEMQDLNKRSADVQSYLSGCKRNSNSSLGLLSVVNNERHENTYRDMSQLNHDEKYRTMWKSDERSMTDNSELCALLEPQTSTSSDSGRSSCNDATYSPSHRCSQSDTERNRPILSENFCTSPNLSKRGFISTYLEEHKKRRSLDPTVGVRRDSSLLMEAPAGFRTPKHSRTASIAESVHSDYASSNTSDYGSNTAASEKHYLHSENSNNQLGDRTESENNSSPKLQKANVIIIHSQNAQKNNPRDTLTESGKKIPFTTFHGDVV